MLAFGHRWSPTPTTHASAPWPNGKALLSGLVWQRLRYVWNEYDMWKLLLRSSQGSSPVGVDFCHWLPDLHTHLVLLDTYVLFAFLSIKYHIRNLIVQAVDEQSMHHGSRFYASVRSSILFPRDFRTTQQRRPLIAKYI